MSAILPSIQFDRTSFLAKYFMRHQLAWIHAEDDFHQRKNDLGFCLMNQLSTAKKRFPKSEQDIVADYFALRKYYTGSKWAFSEGRNSSNPNSHCDIAWAGALASFVNIDEYQQVSAAIG